MSNYFEKIYDNQLKPSSESYCLVFYNGDLLINNADLNGRPFLKYKDLESIRDQISDFYYLGKYLSNDYFYSFTNKEIERKDLRFFNIRTLFNNFSDEEFQIAGFAHHLALWDESSQYCGKCGSKTLSIENERAKKCSKCKHIVYPKISPAVIVAIIRDDKILLAKNSRFKGKMHSILAGFVEPGETLEECIHREIKEEVNIEVKNIRYFGSQPWPFPDSLMIGFFADYKSGEITLTEDEIVEADWFSKENLPDLPLKFSISRKMIDSYIFDKSI